ncbi:hypothetical protein BHE90_011906 [Fusarium euwallaceae]|uniref:Uncharacterized protein n=5 Tax=Fusarium solani species complex TaxID=232080 RepID=A0A3M2RMW7_9HYPO|nr:hypothetical protein CDV36_013758 [Fusarium kuroshium]RSL72110.1 hypothetical protein CEP51_011950 [Fusarium floridanum]RSL99295.1 hypothetical protein CEP52_009814 [Fusarium oligoseptatum]RSM05741.1 hypothetical protein CDV31_009457 [Fusarium ambrosium]RTE73660.1 hypothetical protein BHE90_011906 [Fusarium euwallaceae]
MMYIYIYNTRDEDEKVGQARMSPLLQGSLREWMMPSIELHTRKVPFVLVTIQQDPGRDWKDEAKRLTRMRM